MSALQAQFRIVTMARVLGVSVRGFVSVYGSTGCGLRHRLVLRFVPCRSLLEVGTSANIVAAIRDHTSVVTMCCVCRRDDLSSRVRECTQEE